MVVGDDWRLVPAEEPESEDPAILPARFDVLTWALASLAEDAEHDAELRDPLGYWHRVR